MKIERISEDQIKCILTKEDLEARKINFSELTFGSSRANSLLRDMMQQASCEFGFDTEDKPLMIEVVPMQSGMIVLVITKVSGKNSEDDIHSETLLENDDDTDQDEEDFNDSIMGISETAEKNPGPDKEPFTLSISSSGNMKDSLNPVMNSLHDLFKEMFSAGNEGIDIHDKNTGDKDEHTLRKSVASRAVDVKRPSSRFFCFDHLDDVVQAAHALKGYPCGENSLYCKRDDSYYLIIKPETISLKDYQRICSVISDFSSATFTSPSVDAYVNEHFKLIASGNALEILADLPV